MGVMETLRTYLSEQRGRLTALAESLTLRPGTIIQWNEVPAQHVVAIERATGIPRQSLRPDLYEGMASLAASEPQPGASA